MHPDDEWEDSRHHDSVSKLEAENRSKMYWRVRERRGADKLSGLRRWAEHQQRKCAGDDAAAYDKCAEILQPNRNVITRHAMTHVAVWLDAPQAQYYRPPETERDIQAEKALERERMNRIHGKVILSSEEFLHVLKLLFERHHKELNQILKKHDMRARSCSVEDGCIIRSTQTLMRYFVYDTNTWNKWRECNFAQFQEAQAADQRALAREVTREVEDHDILRCPNRILIRSAADAEALFQRWIEAPREGHLEKKSSVSPAGYPYYYSGHSRSCFADIVRLAHSKGLLEK